MIGRQDGLPRVAERSQRAEVKLREAVPFGWGDSVLWGAHVDRRRTHSHWAAGSGRGAGVVGVDGEGFVLGVAFNIVSFGEADGTFRANVARGDVTLPVAKDEALSNG